LFDEHFRNRPPHSAIFNPQDAWQVFFCVRYLGPLERSRFGIPLVDSQSV
jgi:hypothetical protein